MLATGPQSHGCGLLHRGWWRENEGRSGIHAHFEDLRQGYVRRRCLPHLAWRTCDAAIRASKLDYKALASHLSDGGTWSSLKRIAVSNPEDAGLALFKEGSPEYMAIFKKAPEAIISDRPETDMKFLQLLHGKEHTLHTLATQDLTLRSLSPDTISAVANLGAISLRIQRAILAEVLQRSMFLKY